MSLDAAIGNTPLVELTRIGLPKGVRLFAKIEYMNPGLSIKDRMVRYIFDQAEKAGTLKTGYTVVENTSGNTGAAIAMLAAARGYRVILTMPDKVSQEKQDSLRALGAEVIICPTNALPHSPDHYVERARQIHMSTPDSFMLNQYDNPLNAEAHFQTTGPEIWSELGDSISDFICAGSTGCTISGVGRFLKTRKPDCRVILLDPVGSIYHKYFHEGVIDPNTVAPYKVEGVGEDHLAQCMDFSLIDDVIQFTDEQAFGTARLLARQEGLLCGGSAGANVWGCLQYARGLRTPATIVTVLPDSGIKYLSKIFLQ